MNTGGSEICIYPEGGGDVEGRNYILMNGFLFTKISGSTLKYCCIPCMFSLLFYSPKHEDFVMDPAQGYPNDIALLQLSTPAKLDDHVNVACVADSSLGDMSDNDNCWITGWGKTHCTLPFYRTLIP